MIQFDSVMLSSGMRVNKLYDIIFFIGNSTVIFLLALYMPNIALVHMMKKVRHFSGAYQQPDSVSS